MKDRYLGDGVYASYDGSQIWLAVNHHENKVVALEADVCTQLIKYIHDVSVEERREVLELVAHAIASTEEDTMIPKAAELLPLPLPLALALAMMMTPAMAESVTPIPDFDAAGFCTKIFGHESAFNIQSKPTLLICLQDAQRDYDQLKAMWPKVPEETRQACVAESGSYGLLKSCIESADILSKFKFKR